MTLTLLQISDLHLFPEPGQGAGWCDACKDLDTTRTLKAVLTAIRRQQQPFDLCVVTGDIAQQAAGETYRHFARLMADLPAPVYGLPGNHDDARLMAEVFPLGHVSAPGHAVHGDWLLVFLDSSLPDEEPSGRLSERELERLASLLARHSGRHAMVFVHHHPIDVGSAWLDEIGLRNRDALFDALWGRDNVRAIVFGHVHQEVDRRVDGIRVLGAPSTCIQFEPGRRTFGFGTLPPAWRWLTLHPNGDIETTVRYLDRLVDGEGDLA